MLGGGTFTTQNKVLPGAYINVVSGAKATVEISDRGYVAAAIGLNWGMDEKVFTVTNEEFEKDSRKIFGYPYDSGEVKQLRDLFKHAHVVHFYRVNSGVKASNTYATAKYSGTRGNDIKIVITTNVDVSDKFDVTTMLGTVIVDTQTVSTVSELKDNDFVTFKSDATLTATAGMVMTGGTNANPTGDTYQSFLDKIEEYSYNILVTNTTTAEIKALIASFTKRMREQMGVKMQAVLYNYTGDNEGIISVKNKVSDTGVLESDAVWWTAGAQASCKINKSLTNTSYDGEYAISTNYTQAQLETAIKSGEFVFHKVGDDVRVLEDINSLITMTDDKGEDFKSNQTIRVVDAYANDIAALFNDKYLGKISNNKAGRISLWNDIVSYNKQMQTLGVIEDFDSASVTVTQGDTKKSVVAYNPINVVNCMEQLYMTIKVI